MAFGWGNVFGKIADWFPGRTESLRRKRRKLKEQIDEILARPKHLRDYERFIKLSDELHQTEEALIDKA